MPWEDRHERSIRALRVAHASVGKRVGPANSARSFRICRMNQLRPVELPRLSGGLYEQAATRRLGALQPDWVHGLF
jgi:hypothetical protein